MGVGFNPSRRVRIIGRIRGFTGRESESWTQGSKPWLTVCKTPQEGASAENGVTLSFSNQSTSRKDGPYKLEYCYEQDEETGTIFSREIKPLISDVLSGGGNASVIACGAKGSGKTYTIQGSKDKPGLAVMAMTELLSKAEEAGKAVSISILEVYQERAYDLLHPNHSEIHFLEDGRGKVNLKGLTQVSVKSILEFQNIYLNKLNISKPIQKIAVEQPKGSHKCLIMHVWEIDDDLNTKLEGKMHFVDLAGYEDARRSSRDGIALHEVTRTNKSLQSVMNVVYALSANEIHVPYRESKLTRIFQDSLGGTNHVVMLTCLNPFFCQDSLHILSLASRSCQSTHHFNSLKSDKSSTRYKLFSSHGKMMKLSTTPSTSKKQGGSTVHSSTKKASYMSNGRKIFDEGKKANANQASPDDKSTFDHALTSVPEGLDSKDKPIPEGSLGLDTKENASQFVSIADHPLELVPVGVVSQDKYSSEVTSDLELKENDAYANNQKDNSDATPQNNCANYPLEDDGGVGKERNYMQADEGGSPPLSARLQELSNKFKEFCSATPLSIKTPANLNAPLSVQERYLADLLEPKTPTVEHGTGMAEISEITNYASPWERLNTRSSRVKHSLVEEYLKFLNTADKEELTELKGIGEKRASYILQLREESTEPFKSLDDLQDIGLSAKQVKGMVKKWMEISPANLN